MKRFLVGVVAAIALVFGAAVPASAAGGSDSPTPYTVATDGIYLPAGDTFGANDHVNVKTNKGNFSIHFEKKYADPNDAEWRNRPFNHADPRNQFYGQSFLPWEALFNAKTNFCVTWVQINGYNEHFGEAGQDPVGPGCTTPPPTTEYGQWEGKVFTCESKVGDELPVTRVNKVTYYKHDGSVKKTKQVTETGTYTVTEADLWNLDCRGVVTPVVPTLKLASQTCVAQEPVYTPAILTLPVVENGVWSVAGSQTASGEIELDRDVTLEVTFLVTDRTKFKIGTLPTPDGTFWTVAKGDGESIVFTVAPNVVDETDCSLANSGMDTAPVMIAAGVGLVALVGGGVLLAARRNTNA